MPRYFFDVVDKVLIRDTEGSELDGPEAVRQEAMMTLPSLAKDHIPPNEDNQAYTMLVRNENNVTVYTATLAYAGVWLGEDVPPHEQPLD